MKNISPQLQQEIEKGNIAYIIRVIAKNGEEFLYTNHDRPLTVDGKTYQPGAGLTRIRLVAKANQEISSQEFQSAWTLDIDEQKAFQGFFDNATVIFSWVSWENPQYGTLEVFRGTLGLLTWTQEGFQAEIHNGIRKLQNPISTIYTPHCRHNFGDTTNTNKAIPGGCNLNLSSFTFSGSVSDILTNRRKFIITGPAATKPDQYFSYGVINWSSGQNAGLVSDIKLHTVDQYGSQIELFIPTINQIQSGDNFTIVAGCDKSLSTCKNKFNNVVNFGGFPHLNTEVNFR